MIRILTMTMLLAFTLSTSPTAAQEDDHQFRLGADLFVADDAVSIDDSGLEDVFAAGERIDLASSIAGSAHLAGRRLEIRGPVGDALYAAAADVAVLAAVAGNASLAGYDVAVEGPVGGNLRAAARHVRIAGPVAGTAILGGQDVTLESTIGGDVVIGANRVSFGPEARIDGRLSLYGEDAARLDVPTNVIPADRIDRHTIRGEDTYHEIGTRPATWITAAGAFLAGLIFISVMTGLLAAVAPVGVDRMRTIAGGRPLRALWIGFLALSALIGSVFVLGATLVGLLATPVILLALAMLSFLGYLIGVYLLGSLVWSRFNRHPADVLPERLVVAAIGTVASGLLGLVPFVGWLALYALGLIGIGALTVALVRPEFDV